MENPLCPPSDRNFRLIETFGYVPGQGCARLDRHLARMARSAEVLNIPFDVSEAREVADGLSDDRALRCRMTLDRDGQLDLMTFALGMAPSQAWRLAISPERLNSGDLWLSHKTTQRALYDQTRVQLPDGVDEVIFLNERDELCEGTITNVFVKTAEGAFVTPPLTSGLLPGILRETELASGRYAERVVSVQDLQKARNIWVGNSLRGMIPAMLT
ncbi:hypothetical protein ROA7450_03687 [Roseovarius albus]|uniref:Probable branched-chain-amino-acid aminotransferase n=1 Tax=Roseovarius albus TaxID=1247867 RepID=A0A1X7A2B9_9RHOB|nr:aminotransferase class IV family protein [Roseovarius albus]SLN68649.1 hypothetical protein ROA7450_03687 [Roseovarius albus]